jgi:hypothetical protein
MSETLNSLPQAPAVEIEPLTADDVDEIRWRMAAPGRLLTVDQLIDELDAGEGGTTAT